MSGNSFENIGGFAVWLFAGMAWMLIWWMILATVWTNYTLDQWTVTDRRIIYTEQVSLFHRDDVTLRMERIQDVTVKYRGPLETLMNFGRLQIQTAGASEDYTVIDGVPMPNLVKNKILEQVDRYSEAHMELHRVLSGSHDTHQV
jgi:membrane protein YdbS with pleckstrin-like domain